MDAATKAVFPLILNVIKENPHLADDRPRLRKLGQAIQDIIRTTSNSPWANSRDPRLFITCGTIRSYLEPEWFANLIHDERKYIDEHVIPLTAAVSGDRFLGDPLAYLGEKFTRAMLTPQCIVIGAEDRRLERLRHPNQSFPFLRYTAAHLSDGGKTPIHVYRVTDGSEVDLLTYTQQEWEAELAEQPLLRSGLDFHRAFSASWGSMFPAEKAVIAGWNPRRFPPPTRPKGNFDELERDSIRGALKGLLAAPDVPQTDLSLSSIQLADSSQRISVLVLNRVRQSLFRITIGPERKKFVLYHTHNGFLASGLERLHELMSLLDDAYNLHFTSRPEKNNTHRTLYWLNLNEDLPPVENVLNILDPIIASITKLYPGWNSPG